MLKAGRRNYDNISIVQSKSSKTIRTKLTNNPENQSKVFERPYFKYDAIRDEIYARAKKQNLKSELIKKPRDNHLDKVGKIVQALMKRHKETKQRLIHIQQQAQKKIELQCPFQPHKPTILKFIVGGNFIRRNQIWLQEKKRKCMDRKEEILLDDLSECTFTPQIASKKASQSYLKNRSQSKSINKKKQSVCDLMTAAKSASKQHPDISSNDFESAKRMIYNRLYTIPND